MANILVVDDEVGIRELLSEILADEGHSVMLAENATKARARCAATTARIWCSWISGCRMRMVFRC